MLLRRSIAFRQVIDSSQVRNCESPRKPPSFRQAVTNASCATSSASDGEPDRGERRPKNGTAVPLDELAERVEIAGLGQANQVEIRDVGGCVPERSRTICRLSHFASRLGKSVAYRWTPNSVIRIGHRTL